MKKAFFFDPYLDTVGGGEKYTFTFADYLKKDGWKLTIFNGSQEIIEKLDRRFNLNLSGSEFVPLPDSFFERRKVTKDADLLFWLSDGSVPFLFSKNNILHFQVPFHNVNGKSIINKIKFNRVHHIVCNSEFTKGFIDKEYGIKSLVIYPPIDTDSFVPKKKENIILTVGRFSKLLQAKRQDILIKAFKEMVDDGLKGWKFCLAGGSDVGGTEYLEELKAEAKGYPIEFFENCTFEKLKELYGKSKIFWYAGGYGINEEREPEKTEHFGMTTVEAMASGAVPLIVNKGGHKEIINNGENGYFWEIEEELIKLTANLMSDSKLLEEISKNTIKRSEEFSKEKFNENFSKLFS